MGGASSRPDVAGYRVLRVELSSPAAAASDAWVPYLDVLTHAGGADLADDASALTAQLKAHIGRPLELRVVNAKSRVAREVTVRRAGMRSARAAARRDAPRPRGAAPRPAPKPPPLLPLTPSPR